MEKGKLIQNTGDNDQLKRALERTHTQRFIVLTELIRIQLTLKKATVVHSKID